MVSTSEKVSNVKKMNFTKLERNKLVSFLITIGSTSFLFTTVGIKKVLIKLISYLALSPKTGIVLQYLSK